MGSQEKDISSFIVYTIPKRTSMLDYIFITCLNKFLYFYLGFCLVLLFRYFEFLFVSYCFEVGGIAVNYRRCPLNLIKIVGSPLKSRTLPSNIYSIKESDIKFYYNLEKRHNTDVVCSIVMGKLYSTRDILSLSICQWFIQN